MIRGDDAEAMRLASVVADAVLVQDAVRLALAVRDGGPEARARAEELCEVILFAATGIRSCGGRV